MFCGGLKPDDPLVLNGLAWLHATCPGDAFRDGRQAVELAQRACERGGWSRPEFLGTLAAAHAEAGQFDEAVRRIKEVLAWPRPLTEEQLEEHRGRLRLYEQHLPARSLE